MHQEPMVYVFYDNKLITPSPNVSYTTNFQYKAGVSTGYNYTITLNGTCIVPSNSKATHLPTDPGAVNPTQAVVQKAKLEEIFSRNHKSFKITSDQNVILAATGAKVKRISFPDAKNNWGAYIKYTIELEAEHLFIGQNLNGILGQIEAGFENPIITNGLNSPFAINIYNHKITDFDENFSLDTSNLTERTTIYDDNLVGVNILGGDYANITYTLSATGKHDTKFSSNTLPAWIHAKRFVHRKLVYEMSSIMAAFMTMDGFQNLSNLDIGTGPGIFTEFDTGNYKVYNEHFDFEASESDGTFSVTYKAMIKRPCDAYFNNNFYQDPEIGRPQGDLGCRDNVLHTVTKSVNHSYNASEDRDIISVDLNRDGIEKAVVVNQDIEITINGSIEGLVPGGIGLSSSKLAINNLQQGRNSFLVYNPISDIPNGPNKYSEASAAFDSIFDYRLYDLNQNFKASLGINPESLVVSPTSQIAPSKMTVVRDFLNGRIDYTAVYNNTYNCDPNNFDIQLTVDYPVPVIAEFVIPNNNIKNAANKVCVGNRGYKAIQYLGTQTAKRINVNVTASVAQDYNKCCFGTTDNWNLLDYDFFTLQEFVIPEGMQIPYISDDYVLVEKTRSVTYPRGSMSINLTYLCSDVCEIDEYFTDRTRDGFKKKG